ncbi:hypothetical protein RCL_jg18758.t1 [Rhizophagus clarus]|uniref:Uncharacterized protein n=1 Tax=Rhizophagus clarus TaxID=94130 RepID=A0A8H3M5B9_9GLOM|nr:hypothetical protein RCL_jg18758.t1 [Rhizophagus clarus]
MLFIQSLISSVLSKMKWSYKRVDDIPGFITIEYQFVNIVSFVRNINGNIMTLEDVIEELIWEEIIDETDVYVDGPKEGKRVANSSDEISSN